MPNKTEIWKAYKARVLKEATDRGSDLIGQHLKKARPGGNGWISGLCPLHNEKNPSFGYHPKLGQWVCFSGCGKGNVIDFHMITCGLTFKNAMLDLGDKLGIARPAFGIGAVRPPIPESLVKQWVSALWSTPDALRWVREKRGLSDITIRRYQVGWDAKRQRNTIPIRDERGNVVNVRLYNAKAKAKIINYTDGKHRYGSPARLYGLDELVKTGKDKPAVWTEGEWDRLILQQEGFTAVTGTAGVDTMRPEWMAWLEDRDVIVLFDCDPPGREGAKKAVALLRSAKAKSVKNVCLPLRGDKDDKDVTDFVHGRGLGAAELQKLFDETPEHVYETEQVGEPVIDLESFVQIEDPGNIDRRVRCELTVCGETSEAYHAVESFRVVQCSGMNKGDCAECKGYHEPEVIPRSAREYIGCCMAPDPYVIAMLRDYGCKHQRKPKLEILKRTTVKDFFAHQKVNRITQTRNEDGEIVQLLDGQKQELVERRVYYLSHERPRPGNYLATGWVKTSPKTQQATLLIETMDPQEDDFESFQVKEHLDELRAFRTIDTNDMLADLTENVTRIFLRDEILLAALLTYCSPRWVTFNEEIIRGWLVSVILGDPGSGKSQTCQRLSEFIGVGDTFSGLTGSRTGLTYALVEHKQKGWQVRIGRYPANSRKLLVVDEAQHLGEQDIRNLSKAMEEGFLQIDRVMSKGYESQTRLIMIANPKGDVVMDSFSFGCEALASIFPPTIIRRIDLAVFANSSDIEELKLVNRVRARRVRRKVSPEMLRAVIYWAWNLRPDQVAFANTEATKHCLGKATKMAERYGWAGDVPLVTRSDFRNNLARLAAAWAVLTVSAPEDFSRLIISTEHVDMAARFVEEVYSHESCQLQDHSERERAQTQLHDYEDIEQAFLGRQDSGKHAMDDASLYFSRVVRALYNAKVIHREEVAAQAGCEEKTVQRVVQLLKGHGLVESGRYGYKKTAKANRFFRRFSSDHPDFLEIQQKGE